MIFTLDSHIIESFDGVLDLGAWRCLTTKEYWFNSAGLVAGFFSDQRAAKDII